MTIPGWWINRFKTDYTPRGVERFAGLMILVGGGFRPKILRSYSDRGFNQPA